MRFFDFMDLRKSNKTVYVFSLETCVIANFHNIITFLKVAM